MIDETYCCDRCAEREDEAMASAIEELEQLVQRVETNIARERARLQTQIDLQTHMKLPGSQELTPEDMLDGNSRPILLDAQIALLNARVALVQAGRP